MYDLIYHHKRIVQVILALITLPFAFFGDSALVGDCIHPNDFGYSLIVLQAVTAFTAP